MFDRNLKFPIIGFGIGTTDSKGQLIEVHFTKIIDQGNELFNAFSKMLGKNDFVTDINKDEFMSLIDDIKIMPLQKNKRYVLTQIKNDEPINSIAVAFLKLHLISYRSFKPNTLNLEGLFQTLRNIAWTNKGPICVDEIEPFYLDNNDDLPLQVYSIDKFPPLLNYMAPSGVRVADGSRVRLGAYLASGTTVMHEGFVNFNAGTLGKAMIEGRISAGVVIGDNSDLGGGSSTMGTLSGGNDTKISVGKNCLLGANSGIGISLGDNCIVEAGLYVTAGTKINVIDKDDNKEIILKARELSGKSNLLYMRDSLSGKVVAKINKSKSSLNKILHKND